MVGREGEKMITIIFTLCLLCIGESTAIAQQPQEGLQLLFTCWFNTYDAGVRYRNAVLGYNNSLPTTINATPSASIINEFAVDGNVVSGPITIFFSGFFPAAFVVERGNLINWEVNITNTTIFALLDEDLSQEPNATMCRNMFNGSCAIVNITQTPIPRFCEDGNFCNGLEFCAGNGLCQNATPLVCVNCTENPPVCSTNAPTKVPTSAPTALPTTPAPTPLPTTSAPTKAPTSAPTSAPTVPTPVPTKTPTNAPTATPTAEPTSLPTTDIPTSSPTASPTAQPIELTHYVAIIGVAFIVLIILGCCCIFRSKQPYASPSNCNNKKAACYV